MGGRLGVNVAKGSHQFILIENLGWNLPPHDLAKDGIFCHRSPSILLLLF
jgi:hypothetical protein